VSERGPRRPTGRDRRAVEAAEVDVTDPSAVESLVAHIGERGDLAGLVNAAGVVQLGTIVDLSVEDWEPGY
jgi:NAD(P)-dependent dehydrogenase (short-subunit alcohol dehydrogenase family)